MRAAQDRDSHTRQDRQPRRCCRTSRQKWPSSRWPLGRAITAPGRSMLRLSNNSAARKADENLPRSTRWPSFATWSIKNSGNSLHRTHRNLAGLGAYGLESGFSPNQGSCRSAIMLLGDRNASLLKLASASSCSPVSGYKIASPNRSIVPCRIPGWP